MSQPPSLRFVRQSRAKLHVRTPPGAALMALCMVALQLVMALHFALVPHGFSAGLNGFVHVHGERVARAGRAERGPARSRSNTPTVVESRAACATESCPVGFAGQHSVLLAGHLAAELLAPVVSPERAPPGYFVMARKRALLAAPKTSPPV